MKTLIELLLDVVATYRLTKLMLDDTIMDDVRNKIWDRYPPESTKIGYLFTCPWCMSIWTGALIFGLRKVNPEIATYTSSLLTASAVTGIAFSKGL